jgi:DNA-binding cell septation regulator SpoVG
VTHAPEKAKPAAGGTGWRAGSYFSNSGHAESTPERPQTQAIEILEIRPSAKPGTIKAFVDVGVGGVTLRDCKVVMQDGQKSWVAMPSSSWTGSDGKVRWRQLVELSPALRDRVSEAVLEAWGRR